MTTWVPAESDFENEISAFREVDGISAKFLVYSNEAAYHSDIAEADGDY